MKRFKSLEAAVESLRRTGFKPHFHNGRLVAWKRVDSTTHELISISTEVTESGRVLTRRMPAA
jgi:hypothetical protein